LKRGGAFIDTAPGLASVFVGPFLKLTGRGKVIGTVAKSGRDRLDFLAALVAEGKFKPVIEKRYALSQIVEAHRHAEGGHKKGNLVVLVALVPASARAAR
jgi:NADPH:quinone reductase-like Zn-dependent oxidoreductase